MQARILDIRCSCRSQQLHRLVYASAVFGVPRSLWRVKKRMTQPLIHGSVLALLPMHPPWSVAILWGVWECRVSVRS